MVALHLQTQPKTLRTSYSVQFRVTTLRQEGSSFHLCLFYLLPGLRVPLRVSQQFYVGYYLLPPAELWNLHNTPVVHVSLPTSAPFYKPALLQSSSVLATSHTLHCIGKSKRFCMLHSELTTCDTNSLQLIITALLFL